MMTKTLLATTALVLCVSTCFAGQETGQGGAKTIPPFANQGAAAGASFDNIGERDANARFLEWYGAPRVPPRNGETVLYDQSPSSGFAKYAVASWQNDSSYDYGASGTLAADDFIIPGTGKHTITAVHAAGVEENAQAFANVVFFSNLKYDKQTGTTTAIVKADCPYMPITDTRGNLVVDVSSCNAGTFKGGHDYAVSVQAESAGGVWYWQTNRKRIGRAGFWYDGGGGGSGSCYQQLTPIKTCYPTRGYGPDLAFAIYGQ